MTNNITLNTLIHKLDYHYPHELAESWDQVGLHFGSRKAPVKRIMTALDIRPELVDEAIAKKIDTIIVHHPPIFHPIKRFDMDQSIYQAFANIIKNDINVYAIHTNLDAAWNGMNDWLAESLQLKHISDLKQQTSIADPQQPTIGRIGYLPKGMTHDEVIHYVKDTFQIDFLTVVEKRVQEEYNKVAIVGGAGGGMLSEIAQQEVDVYITGDITYHTAQTACDMNMMTLDAGHYIEHIFVKKMAELLKEWSQTENWQVHVVPAQTTTNAMFIQ